MNPDEMPKPDLSQFPVRIDRKTAAELLTRFYFKTSARSLERWPLAWRELNGRAHVETRALFSLAEQMLAAAPSIMGRRAAAQRTAAQRQHGAGARPAV